VCAVEQDTRVLVRVVRRRREAESVLGRGLGRLDLPSSREKPRAHRLQRDPRGDVGLPRPALRSVHKLNPELSLRDRHYAVVASYFPH
jgi:hypothetical protein